MFFSGVTLALIRGVYIHIFVFCPNNFFLEWNLKQLISKEICRAEHEYMKIHLPHPTTPPHPTPPHPPDSP